MSTTEPLQSLEDQIRRRLRQSALMASSLDELERTIPRCEQRLQQLNLTRVPTPFESDRDLADALAANLVDLTALQAMPERDTTKEHALRDVIVVLGKAIGVHPFPRRPYKG